MVDEKFVALRRHPVCEGVEIEGIEALAAVAELRRVETDEYVVQGKQKMDSVYFVIQGRFFGSVHDMHDKPIMRRTLTRNTEFGLLQAAQLDAPTVNIYATEPSTILEIDHARFFALLERGLR